MKVPDTFSAGATKKAVDPITAAINGNFTSPQTTESPSQPAAVTLPPEPASRPAASGTPAAATRKTVRLEPKEKFLVSMSKGERSIYKAFCALQNVSMNHFVMCAMDYFKEDLENGKVSISSHSYKRNREQ